MNDKQKIRKINVFSNDDAYSIQLRKRLKQKLGKSGYIVPEDYDPESELLVCIGGDGSLLHTLYTYDFPDVTIVGINTGHLGFFQEIQPDDLDEFIFNYNQGHYEIQQLRPVVAEIRDNSKNTFLVKGLNEIVISGVNSHAAHLNIFIEESFIERFSGDGILVSTPAGSTAYNYALGGSIVDPRLELLQVTPIAPINNAAYRSFTSSVLLPPDLSVRVLPEYEKDNDVRVSADGRGQRFTGVKDIRICFANKNVRLLRFANYDFWRKVKNKLL